MVMTSILLGPVLALAVQARESLPPPSYTQAAVCETVGRRVAALVASVEESQGSSPETAALRTQAEQLVEAAVAASAAAVETEALTGQQRADIDTLIGERLAAADQGQFENAVLNCFVLFGIE